MDRKPELLTIKDWGLSYGIKVLKPNGFKGKKSQILSKKYTRKQFFRGLKRSYISVNTEKGLTFMKLYGVN